MRNARKTFENKRKMKISQKKYVKVRSVIKENKEQASVKPRAVSPRLVPIKRELACISVQGHRNKII